MKTYLFEYEGEIFSPSMKVNKRGFYHEEIERISIKQKFNSYNISQVRKSV